jgi:amidase
MASAQVAFVQGVHAARARHAEGPLSGLSFAAKDLFAVRGHRSSAGHPAFALRQAPADRDAQAVQVLLDAGADLVGVTVLDELAYSLVGQNPFYGTPANPRAPGRVCGGSSCGSAAAVAACLCDFALGTDTGGSVRVPASFCGLFGLRPSHGAISTDGLVPLAPSFDTVGFFAREPHTFESVARVLLAPLEGTTHHEGATNSERSAPPDGLAGRSRDLPVERSDVKVERVLIADDALERCDAGVAELLSSLIERACSELGAAVEHIKLCDEGFGRLRLAYGRLQGREAYATHERFLREAKPEFSSAIAQRLAAAQRFHDSGEGKEEDEALRASLRARLDALLPPHALLFMPPTVGIAPRLDADDETLDKFRAATVELTALTSLTGFPQLVVPARELEGAPLGLSFVSRAGSDAWLCALSSTLDRVLRS